ncbi:MAG: putative lipoprotein [Methyloprofundus sp.]|nr:putative lipoprotein [Methyloprofundus sp.]
MQSKTFLFPALIVISLAQGCSFSASSQSSSESSTSISESSISILSSPSSSSEDDEKYQLQILNYTSAYITSSEFNRLAYTRGISEIATANGITSWEEDEATLTAIGRGLKSSNITGSLYETYKSSIANSNADRMQMIQKGYDMH